MSTSEPTDANKPEQPAQQEPEQQSQQAQLGVLEEDDEFEEFPSQGAATSMWTMLLEIDHKMGTMTKHDRLGRVGNKSCAPEWKWSCGCCK